jgi:hypothetical protein
MTTSAGFKCSVNIEIPDTSSSLYGAWSWRDQISFQYFSRKHWGTAGPVSMFIRNSTLQVCSWLVDSVANRSWALYREPHSRTQAHRRTGVLLLRMNCIQSLSPCGIWGCLSKDEYEEYAVWSGRSLLMFGGTYCLRLQGRRVGWERKQKGNHNFYQTTRSNISHDSTILFWRVRIMRRKVNRGMARCETEHLVHTKEKKKTLITYSNL